MRPSIDEWAMSVVDVVATRATCHRRQVGCVLLDDQGIILSTGYNGVASGLPHCRFSEEHRCKGALASSGENLDLCGAIHAEQNALIQCRDVKDISVAYISCSPCMTCCKLLMGTGCQKLVFREFYAMEPLEMWSLSGRLFIHFKGKQ